MASFIGTDAAETQAGTADPDIYDGGGGNDSLTGLGGADQLTGGLGLDTLDGGSENDTLDGGAGADRLLGGEGDDLLIQSGAAANGEIYNGGGGVDTLRLLGTATPTTISFIAGSTLSNLERLEFGSLSGSTLTAQMTPFQAQTGFVGAREIIGGAGLDRLLIVATASGNYVIPSFTYTNWAADDVVILAVGVAGNFTLRATEGHSGVQVLAGGTGNDWLRGADDNAATALADDATDVLLGGDGADTLIGGWGNDTLTGGAGADLFDIDGGGQDIITDFNVLEDQFGNLGFDNFTSLQPYLSEVGGNAVFSLMYGGVVHTWTFQGVPLASLTANNFVYETVPEDHNDTGTEFADDLPGGAGNDIETGLGGSDTISGFAGNDTLDGGAGADLLKGGSGNDRLIGGGDSDTARFTGDRSAYSVIFDTSNGHLLISGPDGEDDLFGVEWLQFADQTIAAPTSPPPPVQTGSTGNDVLGGTTGTDTVSGGAGGDSIAAGAGADSVDGGTGSDSIQGGSGGDSLAGGDGNDTVSGGTGNDLIIGGSGAGDDAYDGGSDIDTVRYSSATQGVVVNLKTGVASGPEIGRDTLVNIENVIGGAGADTLTGDAGANVLTGGGGADRFVFDWQQIASQGVASFRNGEHPDEHADATAWAQYDLTAAKQGFTVASGTFDGHTLWGKPINGLVSYENSSGVDTILDFNLKEGDRIRLDGVTDKADFLSPVTTAPTAGGVDLLFEGVVFLHVQTTSTFNSSWFI
jgi:Ca2+-binding RTX toxin-like protein